MKKNRPHDPVCSRCGGDRLFYKTYVHWRTGEPIDDCLDPFDDLNKPVCDDCGLFVFPVSREVYDNNPRPKEKTHANTTHERR